LAAHLRASPRESLGKFHVKRGRMLRIALRVGVHNQNVAVRVDWPLDPSQSTASATRFRPSHQRGDDGRGISLRADLDERERRSSAHFSWSCSIPSLPRRAAPASVSPQVERIEMKTCRDRSPFPLKLEPRGGGSSGPALEAADGKAARHPSADGRFRKTSQRLQIGPPCSSNTK